TRPGSANASATSTSTHRGGGSSRRGITPAFYLAKAKGSRSCPKGKGSRSCPCTCREEKRLRGRRRRRRGLLTVPPAEFLDAAGGVDELLLAGVERVRFGRHFDLDHRVFLAVGPLHHLAALGIDRRAREDRMVGCSIEKDHCRVAGMDSWFHCGCLPERREV